MCKKITVTQKAVEEEKIEDTGIENYAVEFVAETIKRTANQTIRKNENKMPNIS